MSVDRHLEVILKLTEVCNISCTYCYYFFSGDERPLSRPKKVTLSVIDDLISFLNGGYEQGLFSTLQIDFHGGEPLMVGLERAKSIFQAIQAKLKAPHRLAMTTNAMLLTPEWIELLNLHKVSVCVSIDGPKETHDTHRIDKSGQGTYDRVRRGIDLLNEAARQNRLSPISALCVVQPGSDGAAVYRHIVHELNIRQLDFLLPDNTHDSFNEGNREPITHFMTAAFDAWIDDDDPSIRVRIFNSIFQILAGKMSVLGGFGARSVPPTAITIGSDGSVDGDDFLKPTGVDNIQTEFNVKSSALSEVLGYLRDTGIQDELMRVPDFCQDCTFSGSCAGGQATHRFSTFKRFNNPSIHCSAQKAMFSRAASHLLSTGVDVRTIAQNAMLN